LTMDNKKNWRRYGAAHATAASGTMSANSKSAHPDMENSGASDCAASYLGSSVDLGWSAMAQLTGRPESGTSPRAISSQHDQGVPQLGCSAMAGTWARHRSRPMQAAVHQCISMTALQSDRSVTGKRAWSIRPPISMTAACATIPRGRCSGRSRIAAGSSRALQMHPGQRPCHRAIKARASTSPTNGNPKKAGYRDSSPLEITHQRASYAVVFVDRRAIPLKVGFLASARWGAPVAAGREARQRVLPSRPGEFHPESLTDPDVILSHHPARATKRRLPPSIVDRAYMRARLSRGYFDGV